MKKTVGFLGAGNMGGALAQAAIQAVGAEEVLVACSTPEHTLQAAQRLGCAGAGPEEILRVCRFVFLGFKPQGLEAAARQLQPKLQESDPILVSMLAGVGLQRLEALFPGKRILRIMPNTPCRVGQGLILLCAGSRCTKEELLEFRTLMAFAGKTDELPEKLIDAASALSGCGPAYAFLILQALADGAVRCGLPREKAARYAAQTLLGSAQLALADGEHPEKLKDDVCSPGGSTIEGVYALERGGVRAACMEAVCAAYEKTKQLGKA